MKENKMINNFIYIIFSFVYAFFNIFIGIIFKNSLLVTGISSVIVIIISYIFLRKLIINDKLNRKFSADDLVKYCICIVVLSLIQIALSYVVSIIVNIILGIIIGVINSSILQNQEMFIKFVYCSFCINLIINSIIDMIMLNIILNTFTVIASDKFNIMKIFKSSISGLKGLYKYIFIIQTINVGIFGYLHFGTLKMMSNYMEIGVLDNTLNNFFINIGSFVLGIVILNKFINNTNNIDE